MDIGEVQERLEGIVAIGEAERWKEDGWDYVRYRIWFDDINVVKLYREADEAGQRAVQSSYSWTPRDGGHVFVSTGSMVTDMKVKGMGDGDEQMPADNPFAQQIQAMMAKLLVNPF